MSQSYSKYLYTPRKCHTDAEENSNEHFCYALGIRGVNNLPKRTVKQVFWLAPSIFWGNPTCNYVISSEQATSGNNLSGGLVNTLFLKEMARVTATTQRHFIQKGHRWLHDTLLRQGYLAMASDASGDLRGANRQFPIFVLDRHPTVASKNNTRPPCLR